MIGRKKESPKTYEKKVLKTRYNCKIVRKERGRKVIGKNVFKKKTGYILHPVIKSEK